jgi:hypothetical protein
MHAYQPNGLHAVDENGQVLCWCGRPAGSMVHIRPRGSA